MSETLATPALPGKVFTATLVKGQPASIRCVELLGQTFVVEGRALTQVSLEDEWYEDFADPRRS